MIETLRKRLMDREHPARLHLIGVAGSGMSGLALMLMEMGHRVSGCDRVTSTETERLQSLGLSFPARIQRTPSPTRKSSFIPAPSGRIIRPFPPRAN